MAGESEEFGEYEEWQASTDAFTMSELVAHIASPGRLEGLLRTTDREYIGRVAAIFDAMLKKLLLLHFTSVSKLELPRLSKLLEGPLKAFGARHEICGALDLIGPETCKALSAIRDVRNRDSHEEHVPPLSADDVNALGSVCPTLARAARTSGFSVANIVKEYPELALSKHRVAYMDIVLQIHMLLLNTAIHLELGDEHLSV